MNCNLLLHQVLFESSIPCCTFFYPFGISVWLKIHLSTLSHLWGPLESKKKNWEDDEYISHLISYKWIRRTQYITSIGLFYKNWGFYLEGVWLWRISGGCSKEMMGLKYLAELTSEELSGTINRWEELQFARDITPVWSKLCMR